MSHKLFSLLVLSAVFATPALASGPSSPAPGVLPLLALGGPPLLVMLGRKG